MHIVVGSVWHEQQLHSVFGSLAEESFHTKTQQALPNAVSWLVSNEKPCEPGAHTHTYTANSIHCPPIMYHLDAGQWPSKGTPLGQGIKVFKTTPYGQKPSNGTVITDWHKRPSTVHMYGFWWTHVNMSEYSCVHVCANQQLKSFFECSLIWGSCSQKDKQSKWLQTTDRKKKLCVNRRRNITHKSN